MPRNQRPSRLHGPSPRWRPRRRGTHRDVSGLCGELQPKFFFFSIFFFCTWHFSFPHCTIEEGLLRNVGSAYANGNELRKTKKKKTQLRMSFTLCFHWQEKRPSSCNGCIFFFISTASHSWCVRTWRGPATQLTQLLL